MYEGLFGEVENDSRLKGKIDFQCYQPGFVATKLSRKTAGFTIPDAMQAAEGALKDLGRRVTTYGVIDHHIFGWFIQFSGEYIPSVTNYVIQRQGMQENKMLRDKKH